jgi:hypothetical protein
MGTLLVTDVMMADARRCITWHRRWVGFARWRKYTGYCNEMTRRSSSQSFEAVNFGSHVQCLSYRSTSTGTSKKDAMLVQISQSQSRHSARLKGQKRSSALKSYLHLPTLLYGNSKSNSEFSHSGATTYLGSSDRD